MLEVEVDSRSCALQGYCERIAPAVFELVDGEEIVQVKQRVVEGGELEELVTEAEASCPTRAIHLTKGA